MKRAVTQTPDFSREAGRALASPYFLVPPDDLTGPPLIAWWHARDAEKKTLFNAIVNSSTEADLTGRAKKIWDAAWAAHDEMASRMDCLERMNGTP